MMIACSLNRIMSAIIAMSFLSLASGITHGGAFLLYAVISVGCCVFVFVYVPETKGQACILLLGHAYIYILVEHCNIWGPGT